MTSRAVPRGSADPLSVPIIGPEDDPRQDAFGRLIVHGLEPLIANEDEEAGEAALSAFGPRVSRESLKGFLAAVHATLGERRLAAYRRLCRTILARVSAGSKVPRWRDFLADGMARQMRESALAELCHDLEPEVPRPGAAPLLLHQAVGGAQDTLFVKSRYS